MACAAREHQDRCGDLAEEDVRATWAALLEHLGTELSLAQLRAYRALTARLGALVRLGDMEGAYDCLEEVLQILT